MMVEFNVNQHMMGVISSQLTLRMNNPSYIIQAEDKLIDLFGRGAKDLKEFINIINDHLKLAGINKITYSKKITYKKILTSFIENYEQIKIHESKTSNYSE